MGGPAIGPGFSYNADFSDVMVNPAAYGYSPQFDPSTQLQNLTDGLNQLLDDPAADMENEQINSYVQAQNKIQNANIEYGGFDYLTGGGQTVPIYTTPASIDYISGGFNLTGQALLAIGTDGASLEEESIIDTAVVGAEDSAADAVQDTVPVYRAVSQAEWDQIAQDGEFYSPPNASTPTGNAGKWFYGDQTSAEQFASTISQLSLKTLHTGWCRPRCREAQSHLCNLGLTVAME